MADNYYQTTMEPAELTLTPAMVLALRAHGASLEGGEDDNALIQVVRGDRNRHDTYVFFEEGWRDLEDGEDTDFEDQIKGLNEEEKAEYTRLIKLNEEDFYREVLLVNPNVVAIEVKSAAYCSKMRPGEFGGHGIYVTRTHYLHIGDHSAIVNIDGTIEITAKVHNFDEIANNPEGSQSAVQ